MTLSNAPKATTHSWARGILAGLAALWLMSAGAAAAHAASYNVEGGLSCIGDISTYQKYRPHNAGGASLQVSNFTSVSGGGVNFGLRAMNGNQVTKSINFVQNELGRTKQFETQAGSKTIPTGTLAINARHMTKNTGCGWVLPSWKGTVNQ